MKIIIIISLILLSAPASFGQGSKKESTDKSLTFNFNTPLFYNHFGNNNYKLATANLEYVFQNSTTNRASVSIGYGREFPGNITGKSHSFVQSEFNKIYGRRLFFLDTGVGLAYSHDLDITGRIGFRFEPGKRFQLRAAYTPYIRTGLFTSSKIIESTDSFLTVSIGYRFGKPRNKVKGNNSF